jgi:hypothetical protein
MSVSTDLGVSLSEVVNIILIIIFIFAAGL